jgi:outer membrane murein-binding lipoprotein Lpp
MLPGGKVRGNLNKKTGRGRCPRLARALAHARRNRAGLSVAKLDRLSSDVAFLAAVIDSRVEFVTTCALQEQTAYRAAADGEPHTRRRPKRWVA